MSETTLKPAANALLAAIPPDQLQRMQEFLTPVTLKEGKVIALAEAPITQVYFPVTAVLSVLSVTTNKVGIETAVVGNEGMAPLAPFHHVNSVAEQIIVQVPGEAFVLPVSRFHQFLADAPALRERLHRFSQAMFTFAAQSSACNRQHSIVERCARWLLTTHDRVPADDFYLTHQFLSQMLGVRRSSVTVAAEVLRAAGAIQYTRGRVHVLDRDVLAKRGCECYATIRSTYDRLLHDRMTPSPLATVDLADGDQSLVGDGAPPCRKTPAQGFPPMPDESMADFSQRLRETRERTEALRTIAGSSDSAESSRLLQLAEELSTALEELDVAEEEMRAQIDALTESRHALETQKSLWQRRFDGLPDAFIETDQDDTIVELNRAAEVLLGKSRERVLGKPITTLFPDTERRGVREAIHRLRAGEATAHLAAPLIGREQQRPQVDVAVAATSVAAEERAAKHSYAGARWLLRPARTLR